MATIKIFTNSNKFFEIDPNQGYYWHARNNYAVYIDSTQVIVCIKIENNYKLINRLHISKNVKDGYRKFFALWQGNQPYILACKDILSELYTVDDNYNLILINTLPPRTTLFSHQGEKGKRTAAISLGQDVFSIYYLDINLIATFQLRYVYIIFLGNMHLVANLNEKEYVLYKITKIPENNLDSENINTLEVIWTLNVDSYRPDHTFKALIVLNDKIVIMTEDKEGKKHADVLNIMTLELLDMYTDVEGIEKKNEREARIYLENNKTEVIRSDI